MIIEITLAVKLVILLALALLYGNIGMLHYYYISKRVVSRDAKTLSILWPLCWVGVALGTVLAVLVGIWFAVRAVAKGKGE